MSKDAYTLLGLAPGVDQREIKRAFRRLAMRWHPDRNADPAAIEHFKALRGAYERLLAGLADDPAPAAEAASARGPSPEPAPPPEPPRGADRREDLALTLEEAWGGCHKTVQRSQAAPCAACHGSGEEVLRHSRLCSACLGSGRLRRGAGLIPCEACDGRGYTKRHACAACGGSGQTGRSRTISVKVPPGVLPGDELRLAGEGDKPVSGAGRAGDLRLCIALMPHALYRLAGRDVVLTRPVSALRLLLGGELEVPTPHGTRRVPLPPGSATARELRVDGAGFPARRGEAAGALVVRLEPVLPRAADARLRELLDGVEAELARHPERHVPELAQWEARWLTGEDRPHGPRAQGAAGTGR
jgi:molecular chaperone DnaJ